MKKNGVLVVICFIILFLVSGCGKDYSINDFFIYDDAAKVLKLKKRVSFSELEDLVGTNVQITKATITLKKRGWSGYDTVGTLTIYEGDGTRSISHWSAPINLEPGLYKGIVFFRVGGSENEADLTDELRVNNYSVSECDSHDNDSNGCAIIGCIYDSNPGHGADGGEVSDCQAYTPNQSNTTPDPLPGTQITGDDDCAGIYGKFLDDLKAGLKAFKIIAPIMVAVYTTVEYLNAVTNKDADALKKANNRLISRFILLLILFFLPDLVNIVLKLVGVESTSNCLK